MKFSEMFERAIDDLKGRRASLAISIAKDGAKENQIGDLADLQQAIAALEIVKNDHKGFD
jgi:hypothetical protein